MTTWLALLGRFFRAFCFIVGALAACTTPPLDDFHTLRSAAPASSAGMRVADRVLAIGPVTVPQALERAGWVVRESDTALRVYEHQLWTQDLAVEIAQAVADDLDAGPDAVSRPWADPAPPTAMLRSTVAPPGALRVRLQVLRFESRLAPTPGVSDAVRWTLECGTTQDTGWHVLRSAVREAGVAVAQTTSDVDPGARFDRLAAAHAQILGLVATDIAQALADTASDRTQSCASPPGP